MANLPIGEKMELTVSYASDLNVSLQQYVNEKSVCSVDSATP